MLFEIVMYLFGAIVEYLFGAIVGLCYPPKSRNWAIWQFIGGVTGVTAVAGFSGAVVSARWKFDASTFWGALIVGCLATLAFFVIGNICRKCHEGQKRTHDK